MEFDSELRVVGYIDKRYYEMLKEAAKFRSQTKPQIANYALAVRSYRALHCAADDLENGYYEIAMTLLRSVYENMLQMMYFARYPEEATKWLNEGKELPPREIRKKLGKDGYTYSMLSEDYAHSLKVGSLIPLTSERSGDDWQVNHYPVYSPYDCEFCLFCWIDFAGGTLKQLFEDFRMALTMSGQVSEVLKAANECLRGMSVSMGKTHDKRIINGRLKNMFEAITK
ncbi:MAG: hypothetical protein M3275_00670 [Thermoproteota archaeon]|nr:hypothetical protein [Thermoproteota archaeon]